MRRMISWAFGIQLLLMLAVILGDKPQRVSTLLARLGLSAVLSAMLFAIFVGVPLALASLAARRARRPIQGGPVVLGLVLIALVDYVVFVVPAVWEVFDTCLFPGVLAGGSCELGPM